LRSGKSILGPSKGVHVLTQKSVLLLNAKPGFGGSSFVHGFFASFAVVCFSWQFVVLISVTEN
jgi:hypothetical protein